MASSSSFSESKRSIFASRDVYDKPATIKLDQLSVLKGQDNYHVWAASMKLVWKAMKVSEIVIDGITPGNDATPKELEVYEHLRDQAAAVYLQVVSAEILEKIVELECPHRMWTALRTEYYRDSAFDLVFQFNKVFSLSSTYDPSTPLSDFISTFETEWTRLQKLTKSSRTDAYRNAMAQLLDFDEAKRDWLLAFLAPHHRNIIDNLTTKEGLTYHAVKQRLRDVDIDPSSTQQSAYSAIQRKPQKKKFAKPSKPSTGSPSSSSTKECTWCKKHHNGRHTGHTWHDCFKLKKHNEEKTNKGSKSDKPEQAHATGDSEVSPHTFYLDTCASSHMVPSLGRLVNVAKRTGLVRTSGGSWIPIKGSGSVVLDCVLKNGTVFSFRLHDVLYVPEIDRPLLSWGKLAQLGCEMTAKGRHLEIRKNGRIVMEGTYDGSIYRINEVHHEHAYSSFAFFHEALGHMAPSSIEKARNAYIDGNLIPSAPSNFHCPPCTLAKSTHHKPLASQEIKTTRKFQRLHSDFCGPFPVPSLGGSLYYMSIIDDFTRVTWIRFAKRKSDGPQLLIDFTMEQKTQHNAIIMEWLTDNGGEYVNTKLLEFWKSEGTVHRTTPPYSPESNGIAERFNRTMGEALRAMLIPLNMKQLWAEACLHFVYTKNRSPHRALNGRTPHEAFYGTKPKVTHLQPFGRECYVHIPEARRQPGSKLSARAERGILVGYTNTERHYRIFLTDKKRTVVTGDVFFPPHHSEGATKPTDAATHSSHPPPHPIAKPTDLRSTTSIQVTRPAKPTDASLLDWCDRHPKQALDWLGKGHKDISNVLIAAFENGKRDGVLDPKYIREIPDPNDPNYTLFGTHSQFEELGLAQSPRTPPSPAPTRAAALLQSPQTPTPAPRTPPPRPRQQVIPPSPTPLPRQPTPPPPPHVPVRRTARPNAGIPPGNWWEVRQQLRHHPYQRQLPAPHINPTDENIDTPMGDPPAPAAVPEEDGSMNMEEGLITTLENLELDEVAYSSAFAPEPKNYRQAKSSPEWPQWKKAIDEELASLKENGVWEVVPQPTNRRIVDCKWVFKVKTDSKGEIERYKARLVARGFTQVPGTDFDEIFSPVVRFDSMRFLLAISASKGWKPRQLDVKTAFLYGILKEEVYMHLPEGSREDGKVARLKRCLYGLKQSSREWYFRLVEFLLPFEFVISAFDPCVLVHKSGTLFVSIYVDDITLFGSPSTLMDQTINLLKSEFKVNDMGQLHWLLGIRIDFTSDGIRLSQEAYVDKILTKFRMEACNPISTPMDANQRLLAATVEETRAEPALYQQIVGSINYLVTATRPDLAYTIAHLSQYNKDPSATHFACLKRVLRFLKATKDRSLLYKWNDPLALSGYSDASYGNLLDNRRSFSGYIFTLGSSVFSWRARKQNATAHSTAESEYMALAMAAKQHIWLQRGLQEFLKTTIPTALFCDNMAAIDISHNPKLNDRTKHIDIAYHFIRQYIEDGTIVLLHVPSKQNLADICTKSLPRPIFEHLCTLIFGTK